jgi:autotransporter-associated beta strand protein
MIGFPRFTINEGVVNFLPGAEGNFGQLFVNNPNTAAGSAVVCNLHTSMSFQGLQGQIAVPSSGTNTVTINLPSASTELRLAYSSSMGPPNSTRDYPGTITGNGSVVLTHSGVQTFAQAFNGANTYSGTTRIESGEIVINGNTSGQGNYVVGPGSSANAVLSGSGTVGLSPDSVISLGLGASGSGYLSPARSIAIGTLGVAASGLGGVSFGDRGTFEVQVGPNGASDRLAISSGSIMLTGLMDKLIFSSLGGGFDGLDYTIATFSQNAGGGVFNIVQGLPADYMLQYNPTSIKVVTPQLPMQLIGAVSRKMHGAVGLFDVNLLVSDPVECRSTNGDHTLVFTFPNYLVAGSGTVTAGKATIAGNPTFTGKTMTVNLTGVADVQKIGITLQNVTDRFGQVLPDTTLMINILPAIRPATEV